MKILKIIVLVVVILLSVAGAVFAGLKLIKPAKASLAVKSTPGSQVLINGLVVGNTPLEVNHEPGESVVKLVPIVASDSAALSYETKINLTPGLVSSIERDFGQSEDTSGGVVVSFEKISKNDSSLNVISNPDYVQVVVDGNIRGYSPLLNYSVAPDDHTLVLSKKGYLDQSLNVKTVRGYKTVVVVKLVTTGEVVPEATPSAQVTPGASPTPNPTANVYVQILDTPSGFLRVRAEASTTSNEIARVKPGDKLLFVSQTAAGDWYQVVYEGTNKGWIFSQFAKKLDGN